MKESACETYNKLYAMVPGILIPGYKMDRAYGPRVETLRYNMDRAYSTLSWGFTRVPVFYTQSPGGTICFVAQGFNPGKVEATHFVATDFNPLC